MSTELDLRTRPPVALLPGMEWWVDNPHRLAARVRADRTVKELERWELAGGSLHGSVVRRLKPRPPAWRKPVLVGASLAAGALVVLRALYLLVESLVAAVVLLWPVLLVLAVVWVGLRLATGHRPACAGLHCPGCKG